MGAFCSERPDSDEESRSQVLNNNTKSPIHAELFVEFCSSLQPVELWNVARMRGAQMLPDVALLTQKLKEPGYRELISSILSGDVHSLETMAVRFCEYQYSQMVYYTEVRLNPYDYVKDEFNALNVTHSLLRGFMQGSSKMEIVVKVILEVSDPANIDELLHIAKRTRQQGVVGFCVPADPEFQHAILEIKKAKFGITMPAYSLEEIQFALDNDIKRLGNSFQCVKDEKIYQRILNQSNGVFIECCLSLATHEGHEHPIRNHPILSFKDGVRFAFCSGKPMHCSTTFAKERKFVKTKFYGYFNQFVLEKTTIWSIEHSFMSKSEKVKVKEQLSKHLRISTKIPVE